MAVVNDVEGLKISSNWVCENENNLKNLVTYLQPDSKNCNLEHVTPETCICLSRREDDSSDSKPELEVELKYLIKELNIFSEGSLIEVFGVLDEYLFTCVPEFMDDWEGMAVYHAKIILPGIKTCKLKFKRIKEEGRLWLYSLQLSVINCEESSNCLLFNFENVNKLINNSSREISEKAEKFKKFFELYTKNSLNNQPFSIQRLLNVINRECNVQLSDCATFTTFLGGGEGSTRKECNGRNELFLESQYIKVYLDKKLLEMKEDLMNHIEKKFCEFRDESNARLDHIIKLLENSRLRN